jgi:hypothetical protein
MTPEELKAAHDLLSEIEQMETLLASYKGAEKIVAGMIGKEKFNSMINQITLTATEIRAPILHALAARIDKKREKLKALGVA